MVWMALIIPLVAILICYKGFNHKMAIWEYFLPLVLSVFLIFGMDSCQKKVMMQDVEYWGSEVIEARYYESWSTWVEETCTRTYSCNCTTDSKGNQSCQTCTETYDCSYCDRHPAKWIAYDNKGNEFQITREYFNYLINKWKHNADFVELNRRIEYHGGCGKDGNMYRIQWNGEIETSEAAVTQHDYVNIVQASHSAFKLEKISKENAKKIGLFDYPSIESPYKQRCILGIDSVYPPKEVEDIETYFQYFNGHFGPANKVKLFVLFFYNKPLSIVDKQQAYWDGGNKNEFIVCINLDKQTKEVLWTKCFSWTNEKRAAIDVRDDFMEASDRRKKFNPRTLYDVIIKAIGNKDMHKSFRVDFSYLSVELPTSSIIWIYVLTTLITFLSCLFAIKNDFDNEQTTKNGQTTYKRSF